MADKDFEAMQAVAVAATRHISLIWATLLEQGVVTDAQALEAMSRIPAGQTPTEGVFSKLMADAVRDVVKRGRHKI